MFETASKRKLTCADIGYHGKPLDTLSKEDLLGLCILLAQTIHDCSTEGTPCKTMFTIAN